MRVTSVGWVSAGVVLSTGPGFSTRGGAQFTLTLVDSNEAWPAIAYASAAVSPGFSVLSMNLPVIEPGATENLTVQVIAPNSSFTGPLVVTLT